MNFAPASTEWPICSGERTVPEPTTAPGTFAISSMTCSACGVRSVTSSTGSPPGDQRLGQRPRLADIVENDHRNDRRKRQRRTKRGSILRHVGLLGLTSVRSFGLGGQGA